jgi:hypothetical protein
MGKGNKKGNGRGGSTSVTVTYTVSKDGEQSIQRVTKLDLKLSNPHGRGGATQEAKRMALPEVRRIETGKGIRIDIDHVKFSR